MELIIEIIAEILFDGLIETVKSKRISKIIRISALAVVTIFILAIMFVITWVCLESKNIWAIILAAAVDVFLTGTIIMLYYKFFTDRKTDSNKK